MARHARQRLEPSLTLERVWPPPHADTPIRRPADTLLELVLDFVQQQEHFWPARRVSEGSSLCLSWRATHGKGWSLRLRLSAFGLCPTPTRPSADPPTRFFRRTIRTRSIPALLAGPSSPSTHVFRNRFHEMPPADRAGVCAVLAIQEPSTGRP